MSAHDRASGCRAQNQLEGGIPDATASSIRIVSVAGNDEYAFGVDRQYI